MRFFLNALGINNSAGASMCEVYQSVFIDHSVNLTEISLISGRKTQARQVKHVLPALPERLQAYQSRNNQLLLHAVNQIQVELDKALAQYGPERIAVILGTSTSGIQESEKSFLETSDGLRPKRFDYYIQEIANPSDFLAAHLNLKNVRYTISTACTSSAKAFIEAKRLLQANLCDAVIVGGVDTLSSLTLDGFDSLDSVSPTQTQPFSASRDGINIGEGAALFLMTRQESEVEFLGYGESSDAYHISSPDPEGAGAEIALRAALKNAKITSANIGYINLHGTGTPKNDSMESLVTHKIFGKETPVSSTKPFIGHTLGAAGAQEAAICFMALSSMNEKKLLPPHLWDGRRDSELPELHFVQKKETLIKDIFMSNSFAFGGNNVSLIFARKQ